MLEEHDELDSEARLRTGENLFDSIISNMIFYCNLPRLEAKSQNLIGWKHTYTSHSESVIFLINIFRSQFERHWNAWIMHNEFLETRIHVTLYRPLQLFNWFISISSKAHHFWIINEGHWGMYPWHYTVPSYSPYRLPAIVCWSV